MRRMDSAAVWGILLIAGGFFFLLDNLGWFGGLSALFWSGIFAAGGLVFLYLFLKDAAEQWWAAIPGMALLGLAMTVLMSEFGPGPLEDLAGSIFLGSIGAGFALVYVAKPENWWAIIPGGVLVTLAAVAGVDELGPRALDTGGLFFAGLGLTFLLLALLGRRAEQDLRWAFIPAAILLAMALLIGTPFVNMIEYIWPVALILAGAYLIWRNFGGKDPGAGYDNRA